MTDPAPKPSSPWRWLLLGCGVITGLGVLGFAGCGAILYFVIKATDPIAEVGAAYLRNSPEVQEAAGTPMTVERQWLRSSVQIQNSTGNASFVYTITGSTESGTAEVTLVKSGGAWKVTGARLDPWDLQLEAPGK